MKIVMLLTYNEEKNITIIILELKEAMDIIIVRNYGYTDLTETRQIITNIALIGLASIILITVLIMISHNPIFFSKCSKGTKQ